MIDEGHVAEENVAAVQHVVPHHPSSPVIGEEGFCLDAYQVAVIHRCLLFVSFTDTDEGTEITVLCQDIPAGIRPEDNEMGSKQALQKLAARIQ